MLTLARRRAAALAALLAASGVSCTLFNPLDYLQSGRNAHANDDAAAPLDGGAWPRDDADDADDAPGCGPSRWAECGVTIVGAPTAPGGAVVTDRGVYFTDEAAGEVLLTTCTASGCSRPSVVVTGEDGPRAIAYFPGRLYWATRSVVRVLMLPPPADAAPGPQTLETVQGKTWLTAKYPYALWTDERGARAAHMGGSILKVWSQASSHATYAQTIEGHSRFFFVSDDSVKRCQFDVGDTGCSGGVTTMPGTTGITALTWSVVRNEFPVGGLFGLIAAMPQSDGSRLVLLDRLDDAGVPLPLSDDPSSIRSVDATETFIYWTNARGELRRLDKTGGAPATLVHGLGSDTDVVASDAFVLVVDRTAKRLLAAPP